MPHTLFIEPANTSGRKKVGIVRKYINSSLKDSNDDPKGKNAYRAELEVN